MDLGFSPGTLPSFSKEILGISSSYSVVPIKPMERVGLYRLRKNSAR
jgi:hypothetical protein